MCLPDIIHRSDKSRKGNELIYARPVCLTSTLQIASGRHTTQNGLRKKWNYKDAEKSHEGMEVSSQGKDRNSGGPRIQHIVILFPFPIAFVYLFPCSSLSLQMGFGYLAKKKKTKKNMASDNS